MKSAKMRKMRARVNRKKIQEHTAVSQTIQKDKKADFTNSKKILLCIWKDLHNSSNEVEVFENAMKFICPESEREMSVHVTEPLRLQKRLMYALNGMKRERLIAVHEYKRMKGAVGNVVKMMKSQLVHRKVECGESSNQVQQAVHALVKLMEGGKDGTKLFGEEGHDIYLYISSYKFPLVSGEIRIILPHSILPESPDVCLFTADLQKGKRIDHEPTLEHVRNILHKNGVTEISEVITLRQLKTEYDQYELKRALCNRFDLFLSEAKVCGHIVHHLGKIFYSRKKIPVPIKLDSKELKKCVETALRKTTLHIHQEGKLFNVKIASTRMTPNQITENVMAATTALRDRFPGGWNNVLSLWIKGAKTVRVPFYLSSRYDNDVEVNFPKLPENVRVVSGTLDGFQRVSVHPGGGIFVKRKRKICFGKQEFDKSEGEDSENSGGDEEDGDSNHSENEDIKKQRFRKSKGKQRYRKSKDTENSGDEEDGDTNHSENDDDGGSYKNDDADENISGEDESVVHQTVNSYDSEEEGNSQSAKSGLFPFETAYLKKIEKTKALKKPSRKRSNTDR